MVGKTLGEVWKSGKGVGSARQTQFWHSAAARSQLPFPLPFQVWAEPVPAQVRLRDKEVALGTALPVPGCLHPIQQLRSHVASREHLPFPPAPGSCTGSRQVSAGAASSKTEPRRHRRRAQSAQRQLMMLLPLESCALGYLDTSLCSSDVRLCL